MDEKDFVKDLAEDDRDEDIILEGVDADSVIGGTYGNDIADDDFYEDDEPDEQNEKEKLYCATCGKEINFFKKKKVTKGLYICGECEEKSAVHRYKKEMKKLSPEAALAVVEEKLRKAESFHITKSINGFFLKDGQARLWTVPYAATVIKNIPRIDPEMIFSYDAIESYELIEDGNCLAMGGRGMAPIGGLLFSEDGLGFSGNERSRNICEQLQIRINLRNVSVPQIFINLIFKTTDREKKIYGYAVLTAQRILSALENITSADRKKEAVSALSAADEIKKYKELLDMGAISSDEYEAKKKRLLDL